MCASFKLSHKVSINFILCFLAFSPITVWGIELLEGKLQMHGFLSQGMINTSGNHFLGESNDRVSYDFREMAVNASYRPSPQLMFSGQIMSHRAGESDHGDPVIDYAFMDWTALSGEWGRAGARFGRVKNPYGLYNTTRDVPFTRPGILLPQSIYFERTRKISLSSDGIDIYADKFGAFGTFSLQAVLGRPLIDDASEAAIIPNAKGDFKTDTTQLYQLKYESPTSAYIVALTYLNLGINYHPGASDPLRAGGFQFDPVILSAQYNAEKWSLTGEYADRSFSLRNFGIPALSVSQTGESYYLQGTYRLLPQWEMLLRYDAAFSNREDRSGSVYEKVTRRPGFTQYTKDWTLGLRYDITPAFMLRAEYHNIEGTSILPVLDNLPGATSLEKRWNMWMLLGSYRF